MKKIVCILMMLVSASTVLLKGYSVTIEVGDNRYELSGDTAIYKYTYHHLYAIKSSYPHLFKVTVQDTVWRNGTSYAVTAMDPDQYIQDPEYITELKIPNTVKYIGAGAFEFKWNSTYVAKEVKLEVNPDNNIRVLGDSAFRGMRLTDAVSLPNIASIGKSAFEGCDKFKGVKTGNALHTVKSRAFYNTGIDSITFGKSIEVIGSEAFAECPNLTSVKFVGIPDTIESGAFAMPHERDRNSRNPLAGGKVIPSIKNVDISDPQKWCRVMMGSNPIVQSQTFTVNGHAVSHLDVVGGKEGIAPNVFARAKNLTAIRVTGGGIIYDSAFVSCTSVKDLCLEVDSIGDEAFSIVRFIDDGYFQQPSLRRIYSLTPTPPAVSKSAFWKYSGVTLYVPAGCVDIYRRHKVWGLFTDIVESDFSGLDDIFSFESGIDDIPTDLIGDADEEAPVRIYTLDGRHAGDNADTLRPGIYILRQGRKARKITVR